MSRWGVTFARVSLATNGVAKSAAVPRSESIKEATVRSYRAQRVIPPNQQLTKRQRRPATRNVSPSLKKINNPLLPIVACGVGCKYFYKGFPDDFVSDKEIAEGEVKNVDTAIAKGSTDFWKGLSAGRYPDCMKGCKKAMCLMDLAYRFDQSKICVDPLYIVSWWVLQYCEAGCLAASEAKGKAVDCSVGAVSSDCRCETYAPVNDCVKGQKCSSERVCHDADKAPEPDTYMARIYMKDQIKKCMDKCKPLNGNPNPYP